MLGVALHQASGRQVPLLRSGAVMLGVALHQTSGSQDALDAATIGLKWKRDAGFTCGFSVLVKCMRTF